MGVIKTLEFVECKYCKRHEFMEMASSSLWLKYLRNKKGWHLFLDEAICAECKEVK
jgi:hypothetical protein|tara:strand:+ start:149 stop:316 length:168 start_codon:yes stop_codon:yes gene_type:complete